MDYAPFVLSDLVIALAESGPKAVLRSGRLGPAVLLGNLPPDAQQAWSMRTPYALVPAPPALARAGVSLDMLCWPLRPRRLVGLLQSCLRLGRGSANELVVAHSSVSKLHARFFTRRDTVEVADAGSTQGTRVNGVALVPEQPVAVKSRDTVQVGALVLTFVHSATLVEWLTEGPPLHAV